MSQPIGEYLFKALAPYLGSLNTQTSGANDKEFKYNPEGGFLTQGENISRGLSSGTLKYDDLSQEHRIMAKLFIQDAYSREMQNQRGGNGFVPTPIPLEYYDRVARQGGSNAAYGYEDPSMAGGVSMSQQQAGASQEAIQKERESGYILRGLLGLRK